MIPEVRAVGGGGGGTQFVRPDDVVARLPESEVQPARAGKQGHDTGFSHPTTPRGRKICRRSLLARRNRPRWSYNGLGNPGHAGGPGSRPVFLWVKRTHKSEGIPDE